MHLKDEEPEGVLKCSEAASSSSHEVPAPCPVEVAPPPVEVAPSKAEEVKQSLAEGSTRLEAEAYQELEDQFIAVAQPEDLREEDREMNNKVRLEGVGICARCRWVSGCLACDEAKAWGYACRSTLWHTAHEAVRPKAKPRGRPKKAAAPA